MLTIVRFIFEVVAWSLAYIGLFCVIAYFITYMSIDFPIGLFFAVGSGLGILILDHFCWRYAFKGLRNGE